MKPSKISLTTSKGESVQLPLKGFRTPLRSEKPDWAASIEGMGDGRFRIHMSKIKK